MFINCLLIYLAIEWLFERPSACMPVLCYSFPPVCLYVRLFVFCLSLYLFLFHFICLIICPPICTYDTSEGQCIITHVNLFACILPVRPSDFPVYLSVCPTNCLSNNAWAGHQAGQHNMLSHVSLTWITPCTTPARGAWHIIQCFHGCQSANNGTLQSAQALRRVITYTRGGVAERCLPAGFQSLSW